MGSGLCCEYTVSYHGIHIHMLLAACVMYVPSPSNDGIVSDSKSRRRPQEEYPWGMILVVIRGKLSELVTGMTTHMCVISMYACDCVPMLVCTDRNAMLFWDSAGRPSRGLSVGQYVSVPSLVA